MRSKLIILCMSALCVFVLGAIPADADSDTGWRLKLYAASMQSTGGGEFDPSIGGGLAVEYRASRRFGIEVSAASAELENNLAVDGVIAAFNIETRLQTTPILARLNWHLTPDRRVDLYLGPVAGWVRYGDLERSLSGDLEAISVFPFPDIEVEDGFAWGGHIGLDVPFGDRPWFLTAGATYLDADVETAVVKRELFSLDPLVIHAGIGFRF